MFVNYSTNLNGVEAQLNQLLLFILELDKCISTSLNVTEIQVIRAIKQLF